MRRRAAGPFRTLLPSLLLLASGAGSAGAQRTLRTVGQDVARGVGDMLFVWSAPARGDRTDWAAAGLAGAIVVGAGVADRDVNRWMAEHGSSAGMAILKPFREGRKIALVDLGSPKRLQPLAGALYLVGFGADSRALRDAAMGCASAQQAQAVVHLVTLHAVQRERPLTSGGDPYRTGWGYGPWERHSFFSGHAANIMSCVSYWNERFDLGWAEPALYTLALGVALGRMADQHHWASDVATGTLVGYAVGRTVGGRARKRATRGPGAPTRTGLLDGVTLTGGRGGATVGWRIAF